MPKTPFREIAALGGCAPREVVQPDNEYCSPHQSAWVTEYTIDYQDRASYTVSIMEFRDGKVVHETQYFADPFEAPAWRSQWVQPIG